MKNNFLSDIISRDFYHQCTDKEKLEEFSKSKKIKAYIGFDCTAESLHVGSLLQIMCLRMLQKHGHQPIVLLGGGTTLIGDPSGKDSTRKNNTRKRIDGSWYTNGRNRRGDQFDGFNVFINFFKSFQWNRKA